MTSATSSHRQGVALCLLSAVGFGLMAIFAKEAYRSDVSVTTLLALRFALAAAVFWAIVAVRRPLPALPEGRFVLAGLGLGAAGYAAQAGSYFGALTRIDASLASLLLYVYPAIVFAAAVALRRESPDRRRLVALGLATGGAALVLAGGGTGALDGLGVVLGFAAAFTYAAYILVADRVVGAFDPFLLCALVMTGAAATLWTVGLAAGSIDVGFDAAGWGWIAALSLVGTVAAASAFLIGLPKVGPATASIVSTLEPVVTVALAMLLFDERLGPLQFAGGAAVLAAVILLSKVARNVATAEATAAAPAGPLASEPARG